jgi:GT2 family glycosyltransferase/glycosyltransferase involved in cell wall biosynthesis
MNADRGDVVICIPVYGQHELLARCLRSVLEHTPADVPIIVADDASPEGPPPLPDDPRISYHRQPENVGFVVNVNSAFAAAAPADVVILNSDCEVGPDWLPRLREAAYSDSLIATATALTNHGSIASVPREGPTRTLDADLDTVARSVGERSLRLRPRILTAVGHCVWIRRSALDLVGDFDPAFSPGYGEEVDFSLRCTLRGLSHVIADDVFVYHRGGASFGQTPIWHAHERLLAKRYPYYPAAVQEIQRRTVGPLPRAIDVARTATEGLTVTIDARCLGPTVTGTQVHVLELIHALHRSGRIAQLRAVVPAGISPWFLQSLRRLEGLELVISDDLADGREVARTTVVHRPYQVFDLLELDLIGRLGHRFVITHQDLISYRNPGYSRSFEDWNDFHRLTRLTLALADQVLFFSQHAADDALAEELVDDRRAHVALLGVDHRAAPDDPEPARPEGVPDGPFMLYLGTNFRHKNREFALAVLHELRTSQGWDGRLVFAGPHAAAGTSEEAERTWLDVHAETAAFVVDLGEVSDAERAWLYRNADGVIYPSVYEGFGLIPFEAAAHGTPCFYAWQTALRETLPESAATIEPWDARVSAERIRSAMADPALVVAAINEAAAKLNWDDTATRVIDVYEQAIRSPSRTAVQLADDVGSPAQLGARLSGRDLRTVDLPEDIYRSLRALTVRPRLRSVLFTGLRTLYVAGHVVRNRRLPEKIV